MESATVKFDKSGRSKGFGFVLFQDRDSTDKVKWITTVRILYIFHAFILGLFPRFTYNPG